MLIAVTVMPIVFDTLVDVPDGAPRAAAPAAAVATLVTVSGLVLRGPSAWRLWSPLIGIVVGCSVAAAFGLYDVQYILEAPWFGAPVGSWPGFDLTPGVEFWALLPAFVVVTLGGRHRNRRRRRGHSTGLSTQTAGDRLPGGPGRPQRRRCGQSALGRRRDVAQHHLLVECLACRGHGNRRAAGWHRDWRRICGHRVLP